MTLAERRVARTPAVQQRADEEGARIELAVLRKEMADDIAILARGSDVFVSIAHEYSPAIHQIAVGMRRRVASMERRLAAL